MFSTSPEFLGHGTLLLRHGAHATHGPHGHAGERLIEQGGQWQGKRHLRDAGSVGSHGPL